VDPVKLRTNVFPTAQKQPERLFVILSAPTAWANDAKVFTEAFSEKMQACGTETHVFFEEKKAESLSLQDDAADTRKELISEEKAFSPDYVLSVNWSNASLVNGYVSVINFNLALMRGLPIKGISWQGTASVANGGWFRTGGGKGLAGAISDDLKHKNLLTKCPATKEE